MTSQTFVDAVRSLSDEEIGRLVINICDAGFSSSLAQFLVEEPEGRKRVLEVLMMWLKSPESVPKRLLLKKGNAGEACGSASQNLEFLGKLCSAGMSKEELGAIYRHRTTAAVFVNAVMEAQLQEFLRIMGAPTKEWLGFYQFLGSYVPAGEDLGAAENYRYQRGIYEETDFKIIQVGCGGTCMMNPIIFLPNGIPRFMLPANEPQLIFLMEKDSVGIEVYGARGSKGPEYSMNLDLRYYARAIEVSGVLKGHDCIQKVPMEPELYWPFSPQPVYSDLAVPLSIMRNRLAKERRMRR